MHLCHRVSEFGRSDAIQPLLRVPKGDVSLTQMRQGKALSARARRLRHGVPFVRRGKRPLRGSQPLGGPSRAQTSTLESEYRAPIHPFAGSRERTLGSSKQRESLTMLTGSEGETGGLHLDQDH